MDVPTIIARLDAVEELMSCGPHRAGGGGGGDTACESSVQETMVGDDDIAHSVAAWLKQALPRDLDRMCLSLGMSSASSGGASVAASRRLSAIVSAVVSLGKLLEALPSLVQALAPARTELLAAIRDTAASPVFQQLLGEIHRVIDNESQSAKSPFMNHIQCCFAVQVVPRPPLLPRGGNSTYPLWICGYV